MPISMKDIDSIVIGTAPDMFEGVMMPELYFSDALGAAGKPIFRVHTAGSVGGSINGHVVAAHLVQGGVHNKVLTLAFEQQSDRTRCGRFRRRFRFNRSWWRVRAAISGAAHPFVHATFRRAS
ncbi:MAG: hypothetical protein R3A47_06925 [Polyangiales bacterium]